MIGFRLVVKPQNGEPYQAESKSVISIVHIPQVQPGKTLPVKVAPLDPDLVAIDIEKLYSPAKSY